MTALALFAAFAIIGNLIAWALVLHNNVRGNDYDRLTGRVFEA